LIRIFLAISTENIKFRILDVWGCLSSSKIVLKKWIIFTRIINWKSISCQIINVNLAIFTLTDLNFLQKSKIVADWYNSCSKNAAVLTGLNTEKILAIPKASSGSVVTTYNLLKQWTFLRISKRIGPKSIPQTETPQDIRFNTDLQVWQMKI
jgi:hypothetical protein